MILMLLFRKELSILINISFLTAVHNDVDTPILEGVKNSNYYLISNSNP